MSGSTQARPQVPRPARTAPFALAAGLLFLLTLYGSIIPLRFTPLTRHQAWQRFHAIQLYDPSWIAARGDWLVNLFQYATLAFLAMAALGRHRSTWASLGSATLVLLLGLFAAFGLEFLQVYFPPRTVSLNDLLVESAGVLLGVGVWLLLGYLFLKVVDRVCHAQTRLELAREFLLVFLVVVVGLTLVPFDFTTNVEILAAKLNSGRIALLVPGGSFKDALSHLFLQIVTYATLGFLLTASRPTVTSPWLQSAILAACLALPLEFLQLLSYTRSFLALDVVLAPISATLGSILAHSRSISNRTASFLSQLAWSRTRIALPLAGLWAGLLLLGNWYPFQFSIDPDRFAASDPWLTDENTSVLGLRRLTLWPLVDYYWNSRYNALDQFVRRFLSFAPFGALLALAFPGRRGLFVVLAASGMLAFTLELGQYFIPERHPGTTDLIIHVVGALGGAILTRHVLFVLHSDPSLPNSHQRPWKAVIDSRTHRTHSRPRSQVHPSLMPRPVQDRLDRWIHILISLPKFHRFAVVTLGASLMALGFVLVLSRFLGS